MSKFEKIFSLIPVQECLSKYLDWKDLVTLASLSENMKQNLRFIIVRKRNALIAEIEIYDKIRETFVRKIEMGIW